MGSRAWREEMAQPLALGMPLESDRHSLSLPLASTAYNPP